MKKSNLAIFPFLDERCGGAAVPNCFRPDVWRIRKGMMEYEMDERSFYWLPRYRGSLCVLERNVFLRGSDDHRLWTQQRPEAGEKAYHIVLTGGTPDNPVGSVRSFDVPAHLRRLTGAAMEAQAVELVFYSGRRFPMDPEQYRAGMEYLFWEYGPVRHIRYLPENEAKLARAILLEHRYQKGWTPKKDRPPPSGPAR